MSTDDDNIQNFTRKILGSLSELKKLNLDQFDNRISRLEYNIKTFSRQIIRSGLVGITSSGKSSLLNTLLGAGQRILKEQSKATTNMIVFCSKSSEPVLEIYFNEGEPLKKVGADALAESVWKYTSEDENPQNKYNVKFIKLSIPTFMLGDDLEMADTPGLDAFGHKEHEDLTLREFLPQANLIIYMSSIRSPMKETDRRIIDKIMDADQRIIFVQTCKGAVVEQKFDNENVMTVQEQLEEYKNKLKAAVSHYENLKDAPIVQIETTQAMEYFKNSDNLAAWRQSGLDEFIYVVAEEVKQIKEEFTLVSLRRMVDESICINQLITNMMKVEADDKASVLEHQINYRDELQNCYDEIKSDMEKLATEWTKQLEFKTIFRKYQDEFADIYTSRYNFNPMHDEKFLAKAQTIDANTKKLKNEFLDTTDIAKKRYTRLLNELGLDVRRMDYQKINRQTFFLPNVQKKRLSDALGSKKESPSDINVEYVDKNKYIDDLEGSLRLFFEPLMTHLEWWHKATTFSFVDPLKYKVASINEDMANVQKGIACDEAQKKNLNDVKCSIEASIQEVLPLFNKGHIGRKIKAYSRYIGKIEDIKIDSTNIFLQLGNRLFENLFHSFYMKCLSGISVNETKTVILIGHNYESQVNFLRRFMRLNREMVTLLETNDPPFAINADRSAASVKNITVNVKGELRGKVSFFVLANDNKSMEFAQANDLFEKADVVQVIIDDLHRVGSALQDMVERLLFFKLILRYRGKLLLTYPAAAHFQREKLHVMVTEAVSEVNKLFYPVKTNWFVYENFEVRYCYFIKLAQKMQEQKLQVDEIMNEWKSLGLPLDEPFSEKILKEQFKMTVSAG
ncbi:MAG: dynamin family protein [Candidatus Anammoxibacter sp.]